MQQAKDKDQIVIICEDISPEFKGFFIQTERSVTNKLIKECEQESIFLRKKLFHDFEREIMKYSRNELIELHKEQSIDYEIWTNDIIVYYVYRLFVKEIPIPIVKL